MGFFALVWRMLEGVRKVLHLILLLIIFGFVLAALHTSIPTVPKTAALVIAPEGELVEQLSSDPLRTSSISGPTALGPSETSWRRLPEARICCTFWESSPGFQPSRSRLREAVARTTVSASRNKPVSAVTAW